MVRAKDGSFVKAADGSYFSVPQLARSCSNMPGYITNGNTPQGIFKIFGLDVSKSSMIGPTTNIQMVLPYENSIDVADTVTKLLGDNYRYLLPAPGKIIIRFMKLIMPARPGEQRSLLTAPL